MIDISVRENLIEDVVPYTVSADFSIEDEADCYDALRCFVNALVVSGYQRCSIIRTLKEVRDEMLDDVDLDVRAIKDDD